LSCSASCRPWGEGADESILQDILAKDKDKKIKAVAVVHNETTTGDCLVIQQQMNSRW
jgi:aspartate aminotransferase-like enzyme